MSRFFSHRTLLAQATAWVILPLWIVIIGVISAGIYTYHHSLSVLILARHNQMANLAAVSVSQVIDGYASILSALVSTPGLLNASGSAQSQALEEASEAFNVFDAGVLIADVEGAIQGASSPALDFLGPQISSLDVFQTVQQSLTPAYSNVFFNESTGEKFVFVAVPIFDAKHEFAGVLVGGLNLQTASLSEPIKRLTVGFNGYAYLVDRHGVVIAHPDAREIGKNYSDRPFVGDATIATPFEEAFWKLPGEDRFVGSNAVVSTSGWGLVVKEPLSSVLAPLESYGILVAILGLVALLAIQILLWGGIHRVITPIKLLSRQTIRLASGDGLEPSGQSGIEEIDALEQAFQGMAEQINMYRSGMQKYVGAITQSQEEERKRISRELHDETTQNLLTIYRRLELYRSLFENSGYKAQFVQLCEIVDNTMKGVRQISKDLRPLMLEDLGLVPALQALVRSMGEGSKAIPDAKLEVLGDPIQLLQEQELAIYRITQEALANVRKHAQASGVRIKLHFQPTTIRLEISDDGIGFEAPRSFAELTQKDSFGLMGVQERVWSAGGSLVIDSSPGKGTRLRVDFPLDAAQPHQGKIINPQLAA